MKTSTKIERMLDKVLDAREARIIRMRFGIGVEGPYPFSLDDIGQIFQLTRERIRQIESKAMGKLRDSGQLEKFDGYLAIQNNPVGTWLRTVSVCLRASGGKI